MEGAKKKQLSCATPALHLLKRYTKCVLVCVGTFARYDVSNPRLNVESGTNPKPQEGRKYWVNTATYVAVPNTIGRSLSTLT